MNQIEGNLIKRKMNISFISLVIVDILFLPYIKFLGISLSMIIIPLWFIFYARQIKVDTEMKLLLVFVFFSLLSLLKSFVFYFEFAFQNTVSLFMLIFGFLCYIYIKNNLNISVIKLRKYLYLYIVFVFILSIVYFISPAMYFNIRSFWSLSDTVTVTDSLLISRFTGTLSDPNNLATVINSVTIFLIINMRERLIPSIILLIMSAFITISTLSTTGIILLGFTILVFLIQFFKNFLTKFKVVQIRISIKTIVIFGVVTILILSIINSLEFFTSSPLIENFIYRTSNNSADSRFSRWKVVLENKNLFFALLIGDGGTLIINENSFRPHNGHFHLIYNYGFVAYLIFMWIFFRIKVGLRNVKYYFFMIPFFIGFTVNVGIIDFRFYTVLVLLTASYYSIYNKQKNYYVKDNMRVGQYNE